MQVPIITFIMQVRIITFIMQVHIYILQILRQQRPSEEGYRDSACIDMDTLNTILIKQLLAIFFLLFFLFFWVL